MISKTKKLEYSTKHRLDFITITKDVEAFIKECGLRTGTVVIQTHHTTCRLWVNEDEKNLIGPEHKLGYCSDVTRALDRFAGPGEKYCHDDVRDSENPKGKRNTHLCEPDEDGVIRECRNGHAHCQALLFPATVTMIVGDGKLIKGLWQEILLVELDHERKREVTLLVQGSPL